jgi:PH (Pleckstrin Homology) domain-containing protein
LKTPIRIALLVLGATLFVAGAYASQGPPRLTLLNAGLTVSHGWQHPVGALAAGAGAALAAAASPRRWARVVFMFLATLSVLVALHLSIYRVDADQTGLASRGLFGGTRIPWAEVAGVDGDAGLVVITGKDQKRIRVDTADFRPDQRATLDRTIARRVRETPPAKD